MPGNNFPSPQGGDKTTVVGFTVKPGGQIQVMPTRFFVRKRQIVLWIVGNESTVQIDVNLEGFTLGNQAIVPDPFDWITALPKVRVDPGQIGFIAGILSDNYNKQAFIGPDRVNYSIRVHATGGTFPDQVHDPDGDIKP